MSRVAAALTLAVALLAPLAAARAAEGTACGARGWPWIWLADETWPAPFDGPFRARFVAQLGASLEARHLELCAAPEEGRAGAASEVAFEITQADAVSVSVRDAVTNKRLVRALALAAVPPDARPLTVALAVDELLLASWMELALPDVPSPGRPVPPEIRRLTQGERADPSRRGELGAALAAERFGGGTREAGVDLVARVALARPLALHAALGLRKAADVVAADGIVRATVFAVDVGAEVLLPPREPRWRLALGASGRLFDASLTSAPRARARGHDETAAAFYACAHLRGELRVGRAVWLSLAAGLGVPVRGVDLYDGATRVSGLSGLLVSSALGASWRFP